MIDYKAKMYLPPILAFLKKIEIPYSLGPIVEEMFLPGILIKNGTLCIDEAQLLYPGDVLHEAGHLALAPADVRPVLSSPITAQLDFDDATHEMMTLAWSYAAAIDAGIPIEVLFHPDGYKGQNEAIAFGYQSGQYIGLPMLQWLGMAYDANNAAKIGEAAFPAMKKWLRP